MSELTEIKVGRVYRAKEPSNVKGYYNDRVVLRIINQFGASGACGALVQWDGPKVPNGHHYPVTRIGAFLKWAGEDVTDQMPPGLWAEWPSRKTAKTAGRCDYCAPEERCRNGECL